MDFVCAIEIEAEAGRIFPWLEEPERMRQWMQGLEHSEYLPPTETLGIGVRFRQRMREMGRSVTYEGEVLEREPPHVLVVASDAPSVSHADWLSPRPEGDHDSSGISFALAAAG